MSETTILRSNSINRTPNAGAKPQAQLSGAHPVINVTMNSGGPQVNGGQQTLKQGVTILPPKAGSQRFTTGGLPNQPAKQGVVVFHKEKTAGIPSLSAEQFMLCRHLVDKYLGEHRTAASEAEPDQAVVENVKVAEGALAAIDTAMAAITAAAAAAAAKPEPRTVAAGPRMSQAAAHAAPRRVARPAPPPVTVTMDANNQPIVQADPDPASVDAAQG